MFVMTRVGCEDDVVCVGAIGIVECGSAVVVVVVTVGAGVDVHADEGSLSTSAS